MRPQRVLVFIGPRARHLMTLLLVATLGGCSSLLASYGALTDEDAAAILADGNAIVFVRLTAEKEGEPFDAITGSAETDVEAYRLDLVDLGSGDVQKLGPIFRSPSPQARTQGWIYFTVTPGSYLLDVHPPAGPTGSSRHSYRFTASNGRAEYIGSFHVKCTMFERYERLEDCLLTDGVADETARARTIAAPLLTHADAFRSELARPYGAQASAEELGAARPAALVTTAKNVWREPDWDRLDEGTEPPLIGPGDLLIGLGGGGCYPPAGCGVLIALGLAVWGATELVDTLDDAVTQGRWEGCIKALAEKVQELNVPILVQEELGARATLGALTPADAPGGAFPLANPAAEVLHRSVLHLDVQRVSLADCEEPLSVCLELAVRATLVAADTGKTLHDAVHLYTGPFYAADHVTWEKPTGSISQCYPISDFCSEQGWPLLQDEIRKGVTAVASAVMTDLRL